MLQQHKTSKNISMNTYALLCAAAGGLAGLISDLCFYPFETLKTYIQSSQKSVSVFKRFRMGKLYSGYSCAIINSFPSNSAFFLVYEYSSAFLLKNKSSEEKQRAKAFIIAAALGEFAGITINNPMEVVRQNMQLLNYGGFKGVIMKIWNTRGFRGFYSGYTPALCRSIPYSIIQLPLYEYFQRKFSAYSWSFPTALVSGSLSSIVAALVTTPFDVIRTRMMTNAAERYEIGFFKIGRAHV